MNLADLFKAGFYFKGALAAIHLSGTIIFSRGLLQWSSIFNGTVSFKQALAVIPFFIGIELIHKSSCSHPFDELPFFYYKRVIAATHSFKFTVFLQNRNFSKGILTIILIPPWFQACIYWKMFVIWRHHLQPSIFFIIVSLFHGSIISPLLFNYFLGRLYRKSIYLTTLIAAIHPLKN